MRLESTCSEKKGFKFIILKDVSTGLAAGILGLLYLIESLCSWAVLKKQAHKIKIFNRTNFCISKKCCKFRD